MNSKQRGKKKKPKSWNPAKGTIKRAGWRMREMRETKRFFKRLGDGMVNRRATAASAATKYVRITHCKAIVFPLFLVFLELPNKCNAIRSFLFFLSSPRLECLILFLCFLLAVKAASRCFFFSLRVGTELTI